MSPPADEPRSRAGLFFLLSALLLASGAWAIWDEVVTRRPWKGHQETFAELTGDDVPIRIRQVINPRLGIVDRCQSCHLGLERKELSDAAEPLRAHPRADELLEKHPPDVFGCTPCHGGQGLALIASHAHGPGDPHWEEPILPMPAREALCGSCHPGTRPLDGAPHLSRGRALFEERGCGGCHKLGANEEDRPLVRIGPSLRGAGDKLQPRWLVRWLTNPRSWTERTLMPSFWPNEKAPLAAGEIADVAAYLLADRQAPAPSGEDDEEDARPIGEPEAGKVLFDRLGCRGCHKLGTKEGDGAIVPAGAEEGADPVAAPDADFGPTLGRLAHKTDAAWLDRWLADPKSLWPEATMPRFRLDPQQRADLIAFLLSLDKATAGPTPTLGDAKSGERLTAMYGCGGCHLLPKGGRTERAGPELDGYGDKHAVHMDFGETPPPLDERTWERFTADKLRHPRSMSRPDVKLAMPDLHLSPEEVVDLTVMLRSLRHHRVPDELVHHPPPEQLAAEVGAQALKRSNCAGCHQIGESGGEISALYAEPAAAPPPLTGLGDKVQPAWLFRFLRKPRVLRPWLAVQMPDFQLTRPQATELAHQLSPTGPSEPYADLPRRDLSGDERALGRKLIKMLRCKQCHGKAARPGLQTGDYAPDLALTRGRLLPKWVRRFITTPQKVIPNTRMPSFFPDGQTPLPDVLGGSAARQIRLITDTFFDPAFALEETPK